MSYENLDQALEPVPQPSSPGRTGCPWLAWTLIILLVGGFLFLDDFLPGRQAQEKAQTSELSLLVMKLQSRYLIGAVNTLGQQAPQLYEQAKPFNQGPPRQRLYFVVLAGEMAGVQEARRQLAKLKIDMDSFPAHVQKEDRQVRAVLDRLYGDYVAQDWQASSLSVEDKKLLRAYLGWFGELALTPKLLPLDEKLLGKAGGAAVLVPLEFQEKARQAARSDLLGPARQTFFTILGALGTITVLAMVGLIFLIMFLVLAGKGMLRGGIQVGSPHGGVYAETFACWFFLFIALIVGVSLIPGDFPRLLRSSAAMLLSLLALVWPRLRGIPWQQIRQDIGWTWGRQPLLEPLVGIGTYIMSLPMLAVGVFCTLIILMVQHMLAEAAGGAGGDPFTGDGSPLQAHPVFEYLTQGDWVNRLQVLFLASIVAPIVEETMFRGVLYRQLREATGAWPVVSVLFSALVVSFIFAIVHPTGIAAVPPLMALAFGFTLAREWRGTLIPSMVAHGLSNALVATLGILAMGG